MDLITGISLLSPLSCGKLHLAPTYCEDCFSDLRYPTLIRQEKKKKEKVE